MAHLPQNPINTKRFVEDCVCQLNLMRAALNRVDVDFEMTGTVSCETMEYIRSVKGLLA
jgi:hypothetical protein